MTASGTVEEFLLQQKSRNLRASLAVQAMGLPNAISFDLEGMQCIGTKFQESAQNLYDILLEAHGTDLPYLIGIAVRRMWFAAWSGSYFFTESIADGSIRDNREMRKSTTPEGYMDGAGWAYMVYDDLSNLNESDGVACFRAGTPYTSENSSDVLMAIALYFFSRAADATRNGQTDEAMNWVYEATQAQELQHGIYMWDSSAEQHSGENADESQSAIAYRATVEQRARSENASRAAQARYANDPILIEKKIAKNFAKECWDSWQENPQHYNGQNAFANDILAKVSTDGSGDPVIAYSTIVNKWIPEWNRLKK